MFNRSNGLIAALAVVSLFLLGNNVSNAQTGLPSYDALPQMAGQRTLLDFNEFNAILDTVAGYVQKRFNVDNANPQPAITVDPAYQATLGMDNGVPVPAYSRDPDGHPDTHKLRPLTEMADLFSDFDPLRPNQELTKQLRTAMEGAPKDAAYYTPIPSTGLTSTDPAKYPRDEMGALQYLPSYEDFVLDNWNVYLNSSANTPENRTWSYAKEIKSSLKKSDGTPTGTPGDPTDGAKYLGMRIHFPEHKYNANAKVGPAYDIPAFDARGLPIVYAKFDPQWDNAKAPAENEVNPNVSYNGVVHNVAQIKSIVARVSGRNFPHGFAIRLRDQDHEVSEYFLGYLNYAGWRYLRWENPTFSPVISAEELFRIPLYPFEIPYVVFDSFVVYRNGNQPGGDFVCYVQWVKIDIVLAVAPDELKEIDVDDDSWWNIVRDRNTEFNKIQLQRYAEEIDIRQQIEARSKGRLDVSSYTYEPTTKVPAKP